MSEQLPTVKVKMKGSKSKDVFVINLADFDKNKHELAAGEELTPLAPVDPKTQSSLFGSSKQPSSWKLEDGSTLQLGTVVQEAFTRSELSEEAWNAQPQDAREEAIAAVVAEMVPPPAAFKLGKTGRGAATKHVIFDAAGKKVDEFDSEEEAKARIAVLLGEAA